MTKNRIVLTIGILLILFPYIGFPSSYERGFNFLAGIVLIWLAVSISIKRRMSAAKEMAPNMVSAEKDPDALHYSSDDFNNT